MHRLGHEEVRTTWRFDLRPPEMTTLRRPRPRSSKTCAARETASKRQQSAALTEITRVNAALVLSRLRGDLSANS